MKLGDKIKLRRMELNMSQSDLAESTGIDQARISKIENNNYTKLQKTTVNKLARVLDKPIDWFLPYLPVDIELSDISDESMLKLIRYSREHNITLYDAIERAISKL